MSIYTHLHAYSVHILKYSYLINIQTSYLYLRCQPFLTQVHAKAAFPCSHTIHFSFLHTDKDVVAPWAMWSLFRFAFFGES